MIVPTGPGRANTVVPSLSWNILPRVLCLLLGAVCGGAQARAFFSDRQVLPEDHSLDVLVWLDPSDSAFTAFARPDSVGAWPESLQVAPSPGTSACAFQDPSWQFPACQVSAPRRGSPRDEYLYWAFLNLSSASSRRDLAARTHHEPVFDSLQRPLLAFRKRQDSCFYLVLGPDSYAPLAGGILACPDLSTAFSGVISDHSRRMNLRSAPSSARLDKTVPPVYGRDRTHALDLGIETTAALPIMLSGDAEEQQGPYTVQKEVFDLDDLAEHKGLPVSFRFFLQYRRVIGFRIGYERSDLGLVRAALAELQAEASTYGRRLDDWRIRRNIWSGELTLGATFHGGDDAALYVGGAFGISRVDYTESVVIDGRNGEVEGILADVAGFQTSGLLHARLFNFLQFGIELGLGFKEFELRSGSGPQPDGSASELQIRGVLGLYHAFRFPTP